MKEYETLVKDIIQEENELKDKINRLEYFMMTEDYQRISKRQQLLLTQQLAAMNNYKGCLISRALQLRFEHEENKGKTCEPAPEVIKVINCASCRHYQKVTCNHGALKNENCWEAENGTPAD